MTTQQEPVEEGGGTPVTRACPDWLALRREVDTEARDAGGLGLVDRLVDHLRGRGAGAVRVLDVGAGTGANRAYLAPRLPFEQSWVVVDHDADLLAHAGHGDAVRVESGVCDLVGVVEDLLDGADDRPLVVTCTALLDVLTAEELARLADAVRRCGGPGLFSLSVTGEVRWRPEDPADRTVGRLFDAHQRRGGRPGPRAPQVLAQEMRARGLQVHEASTPWVLDGQRPELLERFLDDRVAAARDQLAGRRGDDRHQQLAGWHAARRQQLRSAGLVAHVGHVDLLALPH